MTVKVLASLAATLAIASLGLAGVVVDKAARDDRFLTAPNTPIARLATP